MISDWEAARMFIVENKLENLSLFDKSKKVGQMEYQLT